MDKITNYTPHILFGIGVWYALNGILHDIFVLRSEHGKKYDRDLLRLLMDGHVLIVGGVVLMICFSGLKLNYSFAYYTCGFICLSMLVYCAMIWPFLKSVVTILMSAAGLILSIVKLAQI